MAEVAEDTGVPVAAEVKLLQPKPGDIVVVRLDRSSSYDAMRQIMVVLSDILPDGVQGFVAHGGISDVEILKRIEGDHA